MDKDVGVLRTHKAKSDVSEGSGTESDDFYASKSDMDIARFINLALLMNNGISEQDAGFDRITSLNDKGLSTIARVVGRLRESARKGTPGDTVSADGTSSLYESSLNKSDPSASGGAE